MKIKCIKEELVKGTAIVAKAVPTKTTMPILTCVLIDATLGKIKLTSNDLTLGIQTVIEGSIIEHGMVAMEAKMFFDIVKKMPDNKEITISVDEKQNVYIICDRLKFELCGQDGQKFSYLPVIENETGFSISCYTMKEAIQQVIFAVSDNEANKIMTGVLFDIKDDKFRLVALDGHRIALRNIALAEKKEAAELIIPGKSLQEICKILPADTQKKVNIAYSKQHVSFETDNTLIISRLIEGQYFAIDKMLTTNFESKIQVNRKQLQDSIDRSTLFVKESENKPIIMEIDEEKLKLSASSAVGSMKDEIAIGHLGKEMKIAFNPKFLLDALRVVPDEDVQMYFLNAKSPAYICDDNRTYLHLILPVNIR